MSDMGFGGHLARVMQHGYYKTSLEWLWFEIPVSLKASSRSSGEGKNAESDGEISMEMCFQACPNYPITVYDVKLQVFSPHLSPGFHHLPFMSSIANHEK